MRFTDRELASLDREGQITALDYAKSVIGALEQKYRRLNAANQQIEELRNKTEAMKKGVPGSRLLLFSIVVIIVGSFIIGFRASCSLAFVLVIGYMVFDKIKLSVEREQKANQFFRENYPPLESAKRSAEEEYNSYCNSDDIYNVRLLLPDEFLSQVKIQALMDLLSRRRVNNLSDAMTVYENMEHQKRIENIEQERLKAAREAAEAQKRAAIAAENTEKRTIAMEKEQRKRAMEADRIATQALQYREPPRQESKKRSMKICYKCKMEIPAKAKICPYCHSAPNMTDYSPVEVFVDKFLS